MKRFLLFAFDKYYPTGGWRDFQDSYDTIEEAVKSGEIQHPDGSDLGFYHVVDSRDWTIAYSTDGL